MARIVLVQQENSARHVIARQLQQAGHIVFTTSSALEALSLLDSARAAITSIIADMALDDMDGLQLLQHAVMMRPTMPALMITGFSALAFVPLAQYATTTRILSRPFHVRDIEKQMAALLRQPVYNQPANEGAAITALQDNQKIVAVK